MDHDKYRRLFVEEARENLSSYSNQLVLFERAIDGNVPADPSLLDAVFRAAHSVKGMAASLGFDNIVSLSHALEDLADIGRSSRRLSKEALDLLLEGGDRLSEMVESVATLGHATAVTDDVSARIRGQITVEAPSTKSAAVVDGDVAKNAPPESLDAPRAHGDAIVVVVVMDGDAPLPHVRGFMVHRELAALDGHLSTTPAPDQIRQGVLPDHTLYLRFQPGIDVDAVVARARTLQAVKDVHVEMRVTTEKAVASESDSKRGLERTVRVKTALLDEFIDSVGELLLARSRLRALATKTAAPELDDLAGEIDRLTRDLHDRVIAARMTPLSLMTERFPPTVRTLARRLGKRVDFTITGADIELDRAILDELPTPITHMLRNAVDHAHEGEAARIAAGKPPAMKLTLTASRDRDSVLMELKDDGGGVDPARVKVRAVERGIIDEARATSMSDDDAIELICAPGFTTATEVSETSGRGVGMDVVKATLEKLGGSLRIRSQHKVGSEFLLRLPLTVAIIQVLVVETSHDDVYAIPVNRVERALDLDPALLRRANGQDHVLLGDLLLPLFDLAGALGFPIDPQKALTGTAVVVGEENERTAFRVGAVVGQEEVVVKPLGPPLSGFDFVAGAALLADGRTAYILEPARLPRNPTTVKSGPAGQTSGRNVASASEGR